MAKREDYLSNEYTENDKRLIKIFQEEVMRLDMLYYRAINSNQKDKAQELLSKIKRVVKELKSSYDDWANVEIPKEYLK
jgi:predicted translin family RNA/ssDNA-binding protein